MPTNARHQKIISVAGRIMPPVPAAIVSSYDHFGPLADAMAESPVCAMTVRVEEPSHLPLDVSIYYKELELAWVERARAYRMDIITNDHVIKCIGPRSGNVLLVTGNIWTHVKEIIETRGLDPAECTFALVPNLVPD